MDTSATTRRPRVRAAGTPTRTCGEATSPPSAVRAEALPTNSTRPRSVSARSTSSWVTVYAARQVVPAPGRSVVAAHATRPAGSRPSATTTPLTVASPVLVTV